MKESAIWPDFFFGPINLWNYPIQYRDLLIDATADDSKDLVENSSDKEEADK